MNNKRSWGILLFALGLILLLGGYWFLGLRHLRFDTFLVTKVFLYIGIAAGVVVPMLSYLSYPRVHNLKVLIAGYITGIVVLAFFFLGYSGFISFSVPSDYVPGLYQLIIALVFISTLLPTFLKYRYTKYVTVIILLFEVGFIYVLRFSSASFVFLHSVRQFYVLKWLNLIPVAATLLVLLLSVCAMKLRFHLGGVLGGTILLFCGGWYLRHSSPNLRVFDSYIFAITPVFLSLGILVHWIARMEHRASYDPLLRIYNRSYCEKVLAEQVKVNTSPPFAIAIVDVDHFKRVNDTYGHRMGDEVLIRIARILRNEIVPVGIVCRYGGDEFAIFFPHRDSKKAKKIMESVRRLVKNAVIRSGKRRIRPTLSIGISCRTSAAQSLPEVLKAGDRALYRAKKHGRNQVRFSKDGT